MPEPCYICGHQPHPPTETHTYCTRAEVESVRQPPAAAPPVEIDGVVYSYGA